MRKEMSVRDLETNGVKDKIDWEIGSTKEKHYKVRKLVR